MVAGVGHIESIISRQREMNDDAYLAFSLCPFYSVGDPSILHDATYIHAGPSILSKKTSLKMPLQMLQMFPW